MASDAVRDLADNIMGNNAAEHPPPAMEPLATQDQPIRSSSVVWSADQSLLNTDVDRWLGGDSSQVHGQTQNNAVLDRSTLAMSASVDSTNFWYVAAMMVPLFSLRSGAWQCSSSVIANSAQVLIAQIVGLYRELRVRIRALTRAEAARDVFAGAMDIILFTYAIGFLLLSLYQASVFGNL